MALNIRRYIREALGWFVLWIGVFLLGSAAAIANYAMHK